MPDAPVPPSAAGSADSPSQLQDLAERLYCAYRSYEEDIPYQTFYAGHSASSRAYGEDFLAIVAAFLEGVSRANLVLTPDSSQRCRACATEWPPDQNALLMFQGLAERLYCAYGAHVLGVSYDRFYKSDFVPEHVFSDAFLSVVEEFAHGMVSLKQETKAYSSPRP